MTASGARSAPPPLRWLLEPLERFLSGLGAVERAALAVILLAALLPASAPTAAGYLPDSDYGGAWTLRPLAALNLIELGLVAVGLVWVVRLLRRPVPGSALDPVVLCLAALMLALMGIAVLRNSAGIHFLPLDLERAGLVFAGYLVASRMELDRRQLRLVVVLLGTAIGTSFTFLTLRYGVFGSTEFGTIAGREALLITEDSLLIVLPLALLVGLMADGLLRRRGAALALLAVAFAVAVNLQSLRRGALIFTGAALLLCVLRAPRRLLAVAAVLLALAGVGTALWEPARDEVSYVVESAVLQTEDRSTSQRKAEIENFGRNVHGAGDLLLGRGLGAVWNVEVPSPTDIASFGGGETAYVRVGWHVYGLDWLYKLGVLGVLGALCALALGWGRLRSRVRRLDPHSRSMARSLALVVPVLLLFAFTNPRLALFAGVAAGLVSRFADAEGGAPEVPATPRS